MPFLPSHGGGVWSPAGPKVSMVTEPAVTSLDGAPVILVSTFMPDRTHEAGVHALRVTLREGTPRLERLWSAPPAGSPEAGRWLRWHPSRLTLEVGGEAYAALADVTLRGPERWS